ncbi:pyruvate kinase [Candidatus Bipolaricaulota bacterium]|nr:pyruvate kinase [Candidatus Bipolaricaulota bacterium]
MSDTRTKIVCTIGPSSRDAEILRALIRAGMDVARINFSHGTKEEHAQVITAIRALAREEGRPIAIMADLQGPKLRIGALVHEPLVLKEGDRVVFSADRESGPGNVVNLPHPDLISDLCVGDPILLDDGTFEFIVEEKMPGELVCRVIVGGELYSRKGVAAPRTGTGRESQVAAITAKDKEDIICALEYGVDFIALSFVRCAADIEELRVLIGGEKEGPAIVAKIEKRAALDDFDRILAATDAVMVARGDLGVEVSVEEVPLYQKEIICKCNAVGKPVITATQMLQSMILNPTPTRAEAGDVANAILDGTDAVMLSGETAIGRYPVRAVEVMARISATVEEKMPCWVDKVDFADVEHMHSITAAISDATATIAKNLGTRLIVASTWSGYTARQIARERPRESIIAFTPNATTFTRLALTWGVQPLLVPQYRNTEEMLEMMAHTVIKLNLARPGDLIIVTGAIPLREGGRTDFLKVHRLDEGEA